MLEIYYGETKGKERICIGASIIAVLRDKNVLWVDFQQKDENYDRLFDVAPHIIRLTLEPNTSVQEYFAHAVRLALSFQYTVLILRGVFDAVDEGKLSVAEVYEFFSNAPDSIEIICTGTDVQEKFLPLANEIVELNKG